MRSKMVALFLVLGLAASVTACGGSQETETPVDSTPLTEETVDTESGDIEETPETEKTGDIEEAAETLESGQDIPEEIEETEEAEEKAN